MEPNTKEIWDGLPSSAEDSIALVSIAISLKRIADQLNYQPDGDENLFDCIREISRKSW